MAPHRGRLASSLRADRLKLLDQYWSHLAAAGWEDLCRQRLPLVGRSTPLGKRGPWGPASRFWRASAPEWDLVSESLDGERLLLGEVKWSGRSWSKRSLDSERRKLAQRDAPALTDRFGKHTVVRALFVPELARGVSRPKTGPLVITASDMLR